MKKISLFTPCYNEEGNVREMYGRVTEVMRNMPQYDYEYVFIDNKSTDKTRDILRDIAATDSRVKVIFNTRNFGPGRSGAYGFFQTTGDVTICMACDLQDPPELIPQFIGLWEKGYKVVLGYKTGSKESKGMYLIRTVYYKIIKLLSDNKQYEHVTGFGLYDKEVVARLRNEDNPHPNFRYSVTEYGYEIGFVEYNQPARKKGESSYNFWRYLDTAIESLVSTSQKPLRLITLFGCISTFFFAFYGVLKFLARLVQRKDNNVKHYSDTLFLGIVSSVHTVFIGVIGEYLREVLLRSLKEPLVVEEERINFDLKDEKK